MHSGAFFVLIWAFVVKMLNIGAGFVWVGGTPSEDQKNQLGGHM